jgi:hypothetical protein
MTLKTMSFAQPRKQQMRKACWWGLCVWAGGTWNDYQMPTAAVEVVFESVNAEFLQCAFMEEPGCVLAEVAHVVEELEVVHDVVLAGLKWETCKGPSNSVGPLSVCVPGVG